MPITFAGVLTKPTKPLLYAQTGGLLNL